MNARSSTADASPAAVLPPPQAAVLRGLRILVVDDNPMNRQVVQTMLSRHGAQVDTAHDGLSAVAHALAADPPFDAILMDVRMPGMDGYAAAGAIRAAPAMQAVPIIAMSASDLPSDAARRRACGIGANLVKPLDHLLLARTVQQACLRSASTGRSPTALPVLLEAEQAVARLGGDVGLYARLCTDFGQSSIEMVAAVRAALGRQDVAAACDLLHGLRGSAGNVGARLLQEWAARIEADLKEMASPAGLADTVEELHAVAVDSCAAVRAFCDGVSTERPPMAAAVIDGRRLDTTQPLLLVVDDHADNRQILHELFSNDHEVCLAASGSEALLFCQTRKPDLILLDVVMPGLGGFAVCRRLKADPRTAEIPVIFVTAQNDPVEEARGLETGAVDFITKPFHAKVVQARVRTHLMLKSQADLLRSRERELRRRQAELESISDASPLGQFRVDATGLCTYVNRTFERICGLAEGEALRSGWRTGIHPDDTITVAAQWLQCSAEQRPYEGTHRYLLRGGRLVHVQVKAAPIVVDGQLEGYVGTVEDITARRAAEEALIAGERRMRLVTNNVPAAIGYVDAERRYRFCNVNYQRMLGVDQANMIGKSIAETFGEAAYARMKARIDRAMAGERVSFERLGTINGEQRSLQCEYVPDRDDTGAVVGFYTMVTDVTARRAAEQELANSERRIRMITDNIPVLVTYIDSEHRFQFANATMEQWTGVSPEAVRGKPFAEALDGGLYDNRRPYIERALRGERLEFELVTEESGRTIHLHSTYIPDVDADGRVLGIYTMSSDISALKKTEEELRHLARFDSLTGLPNRSHLYELLDAALVRRQRSGLGIGVMFLDVDRFKSINDSLGHAVGDQVLKEFSARLTQAVRQSDTVARLAGDEFIIVLEGLKVAAEAEQVAAKILELVSAPWTLDGVAMVITTSIGVVHADSSAHTGTDLIAIADKALYEAKAAGRNTFRLKRELP